MQFGVFSIGYLEQDPPMTGPVVRAKETIREIVLLAQHAEDVGLDVFAARRRGRPPSRGRCNPQDCRLFPGGATGGNRRQPWGPSACVHGCRDLVCQQHRNAALLT
jgi:hypothetical protein